MDQCFFLTHTNTDQLMFFCWNSLKTNIHSIFFLVWSKLNLEEKKTISKEKREKNIIGLQFPIICVLLKSKIPADKDWFSYCSSYVHQTAYCIHIHDSINDAIKHCLRVVIWCLNLEIPQWSEIYPSIVEGLCCWLKIKGQNCSYLMGCMTENAKLGNRLLSMHWYKPLF